MKNQYKTVLCRGKKAKLYTWKDTGSGLQVTPSVECDWLGGGRGQMGQVAQAAEVTFLCGMFEPSTMRMCGFILFCDLKNPNQSDNS